MRHVINHVDVCKTGPQHPRKANGYQVTGVCMEGSVGVATVCVLVNTQSQAFDMAKKLYGSDVLIPTEHDLEIMRCESLEEMLAKGATLHKCDNDT